MTEPLLHTVDEVAAILRCHRTQVYKLIQRGQLQTSPRVGRSLTVLRSSLLAFIGSVPPAQPRARRPRAPKWSPDGLDTLRIN